MHHPIVGVIGGSGLYQFDALHDRREITVDTPFGSPSDAIVVGLVGGVPAAFLARHGRAHGLLPGEVPYRANVYALKSLGIRYLISVSAVGSLREEYRPLDMVLPDQFIDLTTKRESTFFGHGAVAHVSMAQPVCPAVVEALATGIADAGLSAKVRVHRGGTYVCIEGPQFSTLAESQRYRAMGADVIGMTNMPEARLAREAQIAYATLALVTDYDCWHPRESVVTADTALANLRSNVSRAKRVVAAAIRRLGEARPASPAHDALAVGLVTRPEDCPPETRARLAAILPAISRS